MWRLRGDGEGGAWLKGAFYREEKSQFFGTALRNVPSAMLEISRENGL